MATLVKFAAGPRLARAAEMAAQPATAASPAAAAAPASAWRLLIWCAREFWG